MTQILDSLPADYADRILCCYVNNDRNIKVVRIINIAGWYFERVVFPGDRLLFESVSQAQLEVYAMIFSTVALVEITACDRLAVKDPQTDQKCIAQRKEILWVNHTKALKFQKVSLTKRAFLATSSRSRKWQILLPGDRG